ncbi:hypothetical protein AKJ65_05380 [candidate division MSBL1 archaeon SCGC-AAA259E19]|uniref:Uncharacterized protein n=1 Tax=candidate division MSBL1 archaeon SCGC-AAA259E19 TaxID=1698264 RepID=A0A133UIS1_9EURY|nr:hypothetical protein AKJ65_05380 [candidate division MSBL1 archaeon SCGC-AAA259E19]
MGIRKKIMKFRIWLSAKLWYGGNPDETMAKRFKLFVGVAVLLIGVSKLLYLTGVTLPNVELIIPTLVVVGAFSLYTGGGKNWEKVRKYFGLIALLSVLLIDLVFWGFKTIYLFTWPAFVLCWFLGMRKDLSFFDKFSDLAVKATLTGAVAILAFDMITAFGTWLLWRPLTLGALYGVYAAQVPFTFYHLASLIFIPPLVGFGKIVSRVKMKVPVAVKAKVKERERR